MNPNTILSAVTDILRQAAKLMEREISVTEKDGAANLVTETDLAIQRFLQEQLAPLVPHCGFLCEENDVADTQKEYVWIIDPIDGTTNYIRGLPDCAISVALAQGDTPLLGAVYAPRTDRMFTAVRGGGAHCNGQPIHVSNKRFDQSLLCTALCLYQKELARPCADILLELHPKISDIRRLGSCALELCYLAMGLCDLYFEIRICPWDYAAAYLILTEAGGILRGYRGARPNLRDLTLLVGANNEENYRRLDAVVAAHIPESPIYKE